MGLVEFVNGKEVEGEITKKKFDQKTVFEFKAIGRQEKRTLSPTEVRQLVVFKSENKRKNERYLSHRDVNGEHDFVHIVKYGSTHIFTSLNTDVNYIGSPKEPEAWLRIAAGDELKWKHIVDSVFTLSSPYFYTSSAYKTNLKGIERLVNYEASDFSLYPSPQYGVRVSVGQMSVSDFSSFKDVTVFFPEDQSFSVNSYSLNGFYQRPVLRNGRLMIMLNAGLSLLSSSGYSDERNKISAFSAKVRTVFGAARVLQYIQLGKVFPYIGLGFRSNYVLSQNGIASSYSTLGDDRLNETERIKIFQTPTFSPELSIGLSKPFVQKRLVNFELLIGVDSYGESQSTLHYRLVTGVNINQ